MTDRAQRAGSERIADRRHGRPLPRRAGPSTSFWSNLARRRRVDHVLHRRGAARRGRRPAAARAIPRYVQRGRVLDGRRLFDAAFFGFSPREAEVIDPQQRVFLECAWEALERAGYDAGRVRAARRRLRRREHEQLPARQPAAEPPSVIDAVGALPGDARQRQGLPGHARVLQAQPGGPSVTVQTACSTSLVAVHLACQSLLERRVRHGARRRRVDRVPAAAGLPLSARAAILSPDGHCRAFDAQAQGTVVGNGVGVVVLKRLARRAGRRRHDPRGHPRRGRQQRRLAQGRLHRAERRRPGRGHRARPRRWPASSRRRSATSRPTAPARRSATRSRSRR